MRVLLVDDEPGIREGLAALLRRKGHLVRTAGDLAGGLEALHGEAFDAVVTDWRLPDGDAGSLVRASAAPVLAVSGHPEEVVRAPNVRQVLCKPLLPKDLMVALQRLEPPMAESARAAGPGLESLPEDARAIVQAALALLGTADLELHDDGVFVTLRAALPPGADAALDSLELLGGDLRVLAPGGRPFAELRFYRDGRPDDGAAVVGWSEPWPPVGDFAVDFGRGDAPEPRAFLRYLDRAAAAARTGRQLWFLNLPAHLRLYAEVSGRGVDLPKRTRVGPRLPEVLSELWS
jgi:CheY-like chemotaxis protein